MNDAPSLKKSDCGIAVEGASEAAQVNPFTPNDKRNVLTVSYIGCRRYRFPCTWPKHYR